MFYFSSCARRIPFRFNIHKSKKLRLNSNVYPTLPLPPHPPKIEFIEPRLNTTVKRKLHSPHFHENGKENQDKCQNTSWIFTYWRARLWQNLEEQEKMSLLLFRMNFFFKIILKVLFGYFFCAFENGSKLKNPVDFEIFLYIKIVYSLSNVSI